MKAPNKNPFLLFLCVIFFGYNIIYCENIETVTIAILAKDKAYILPIFLKCIEAQTWPKNRTYIYIRTNNNNDNSAEILRNWVDKIKTEYLDIFFDATDTVEKVQQYSPHEWNCERFKVLGKIRQDSMNWAYEHNSHYFVVDCDNVIKQNTLDALVKTNLPIVAPFLKGDKGLYANFHADIDENGYYKGCPLYYMLFNQEIKGLTAVPVVHCTYLIRHECIKSLYYDDDSYRYEYVIFSDSARKNNINQYLDTRELYGYCSMSIDTQSFLTETEIQQFLINIGILI